MHGADAGRRPQANPTAIKGWLTVPWWERALRVLTVPRTFGLSAHELVKPLAREWALEPVEELRSRIGLIVMLAVWEYRELDQAERFGDADTADVFTEISRETDKQLWLVEAHLYS